jgi:chitinase
MNSFDAELYPRFTNLKSSTSGLKVFISVGGWAAGGKIFSDMVGSAGNRATFIASALQFMATYSFDGMSFSSLSTLSPILQFHTFGRFD